MGEMRSEFIGWQSLGYCLARARKGDEEAVALLCGILGPRLRAHVARRMGPRVSRWIEPDDVVQQVLFELTRSFGALPPEADEAELLRRAYRTANSRILDALNKRDRDVGESAVPEHARERAQAFASTGSVTREDDRRWLHEFVARLPEEYREVVRMCALEELSYVEAARRLGMSSDTVRKRYNRARALLADGLARRNNA
jgi:RNA polymerase sigma-70 factor (ECF subfamily)